MGSSNRLGDHRAKNGLKKLLVLTAILSKDTEVK